MSARRHLQWSEGAAGPVLAAVDVKQNELAWQDRALCAETDPEAFFPEKGDSARKAKQVCSGCEVRAKCLEFALVTDQRFGVWGGLSERQRRRLKRPAEATASRTPPARRRSAAEIRECLARGEKQCARCGQTKQLGGFHAHAGKPDGRMSWCAGCVTEYKRLQKELAA